MVKVPRWAIVGDNEDVGSTLDSNFRRNSFFFEAASKKAFDPLSMVLGRENQAIVIYQARTRSPPIEWHVCEANILR